MNGFITRRLSACLVTAGVLSALGCCPETYNYLVDPCWPERYNAIAREEVRTPLATQAGNGLVLEQTVWNYHFEEGSPHLTPGGYALLDRLARRRPVPVADVFIQTSHDVPFDAEQPEVFVLARKDLDEQRAEAVKRYLTAIRPDVAFQMGVHDPGQIGMMGVEASAGANRVILGVPRGTLATEREQTNRQVNEQNSETTNREAPPSSGG